MKRLFISLEVIGMVVILIMALTVPENPYEIVPALSYSTFDKPEWLRIFEVIGFLYSATLFSFYNILKQKKSSTCKNYSSSKSSNNNLM